MTVTLLLAAAASLLLLGSCLVIRAVIQSDTDSALLQPKPVPMSETSDVAQHRRAA